MTSCAARCLNILIDLQATKRGYINACGCPFPIRTSNDCISSLTTLLFECILAIIWGSTTNHISILTSEKPFCNAI
uniref:TOR n=1 Tax=Arundo donax TaxID=35708 RepID=A0A0A9EEC2_ARUDO